jgi:hypothetical protein
MSYDNPRINDLNMTTFDGIMKMSNGNPGAVRVCAELIKQGDVIDPRSMGGLGAILMMDSLDIYEDKIWLLYSDVCHQNLSKLVAILRAYQLGQLEGCTEHAIHHAINNNGEGLDIDKIVTAVTTRLPDFRIIP